MKHQPQSTRPAGISTATISFATAKVHEHTTQGLELSSSSIPEVEVSTEGSSDNPIEAAQQTSTAGILPVVSSDGNHEEVPEVNAETTETNYATPETNHESPEPAQETQEQNQELPEKSEEETFSISNISSTEVPHVETSRYEDTFSLTNPPEGVKKVKPSVDGVVDEIYEIVRTTISPFIEELEESGDDSKSRTKTSSETKDEDEEEETR